MLSRIVARSSAARPGPYPVPGRPTPFGAATLGFHAYRAGPTPTTAGRGGTFRHLRPAASCGIVPLSVELGGWRPCCDDARRPFRVRERGV